MIKEAKQTAAWLWDVARNPDVVWVDPESGEEASRERWTRMARWHTLRPIWMYHFLTTKAACGCRRRFGLWRVITCGDHLGFDLTDGVDE